MEFVRPFFEGKNRLLQAISLLIFVIFGAIVFTALGDLVNYAVFHTHIMSEAANPAAFARIEQSFASLGVFLFPALLFAFCHDKKCLHYNAADRWPNYLLVNVTLVLSVTVLPLVAALSGWNESIHLPSALSKVESWMLKMESQTMQIQHMMTYQHDYLNLTANLITLALLPAVCEEFLFQGTIQRFFHKGNMNPHLAIWVTAFIFSAIHLQFFGFIPRLLLGAYLGYLFYWSRSLWLPILAHFLHNALTLLISFTFEGRGIFLDDVRFTDVKGAIPTLVGSALVTAMSLVFMWKTQKEFNQDDEKWRG